MVAIQRVTGGEDKQVLRAFRVHRSPSRSLGVCAPLAPSSYMGWQQVSRRTQFSDTGEELERPTAHKRPFGSRNQPDLLGRPQALDLEPHGCKNTKLSFFPKHSA